MTLVGSTTRLEAEFTDFQNNLVDPQQITIAITEQISGNLITTIDYQSIVRDSLGEYHYDYVVPNGRENLIYQWTGIINGSPSVDGGVIIVEHIGALSDTKISEICDLFLSEIDDYRINTIYSTSGSIALNIYLEPYLLKSIDDFSICNQDLFYTTSSSSVEGSFDVTLTQQNKNILSRLMLRYWMTKNVQNILQMTNLLQDRDFHNYSAAQNLKAKQDYLNSLKEELDLMLSKYEFGNNDWTGWKNQVFD